MDQGTPAEILSRLGTVKNPVLFTSGSFSSAMLWFGRDLVQNQNLLPAVTGAAMVVFSLFVAWAYWVDRVRVAAPQPQLQ